MKIKTEIKREYGISLHYQVRKEIENLLKESDFSSTPLPQEEKLAEIFKVSRGTVRRALSDLVNQGVLYRIPGKGTFVNKKVLSTERITVFSPWLLHKEPEIAHNTYEDILLRALRRNAIEKGFTLVLKDFIKEEIEFSNSTKESAGMIILNPRRNNEDIIDRISSFSYPAIVIGANLKRKDIDYVASDNEGGVKEAIEYLLSLGNKNLFFLGGSPESYDTDERFNVFKKICEKKSIKYGIKILESDVNWREETIKLIKELNSKGVLPEGFICGGITLSLYVYEGIRSIGKEAGKDISVIGFDDFPVCTLLPPPLTAIYQPIEMMAKTGIELLEEKIRNNKREKKQIILPTKLIIRNSCKGSKK